MAILVAQQADELTTRYHPDMMFLHSLPGTGESQVNYDLKHISIAGLTMDVDFFIIGEVKGGEALYLLNAACTGQICAATIHASSADRAADKLVDYAMYESRYSRNELMRMMDCFQTLVFMERCFSAGDGMRRERSLSMIRWFEWTGCFVCLFAGFLALLYRIRWLEQLSEFLKRTRENLDEASRRRLLENRRRLQEMRTGHSLWTRLEQELCYSGWKLRFPAWNAEWFLAGTLTAGATLFVLLLPFLGWTGACAGLEGRGHAVGQ